MYKARRPVYMQDSPDINADTLEADIKRYDGLTLDQFRVVWDINQFNLDNELEFLGDENVLSSKRYTALFYLGGEALVNEVLQRNAKNILRKYSAWNGRTYDRGGVVAWYLNKTLLYLLSKKAAVEAETKPTTEQKEDLKILIQRVLERIADADNGCVDQQTSQLKLLSCDIIDDFGFSGIQKRMAMALDQYRMELMNKWIIKTREPHAADLGVDLMHKIVDILELPQTRATRRKAAFPCYSNSNYKTAKKCFFDLYNPVKYLMEQTQYYSKSPMFSHMCQWYQDKLFKGLTETEEAKFETLLGADFIWSFKRKDAAALYYLEKNGLIIQK